MPRKKKITIEQWKKAIDESCGIVGMVALMLGVSRHTVARHRDSDAEIKELFVEAETMAKDRAEFNIQAALATAEGASEAFQGQVAEACARNRVLTLTENRELYRLGPGGAWQPYPRRPRSYFAQVLTTYRNRSSRHLCFPG